MPSVPAFELRPEPGRAGATRRQALAAAGLAPVLGPILLGPILLAGCSLRVGQPFDVPGTTPPPTKDETARERGAGLADDLARTARSAADGLPALADRLLSLAAAHQAQATALRPPAPAGSDAPAVVRSAGRPAGGGLLGSLAARERAAATALADDLRTTSATTARLLASVRANWLVQAEQLTRWAQEEDG